MVYFMLCASDRALFKVAKPIFQGQGLPVQSVQGANENFKVFLPPNTISLLQLLGKGVIKAFKCHYTKRSQEDARGTGELRNWHTRLLVYSYNIAYTIEGIKESKDEVIYIYIYLQGEVPRFASLSFDLNLSVIQIIQVKCFCSVYVQSEEVDLFSQETMSGV